MILCNKRTKKSAYKLKQGLKNNGYKGIYINYGNSSLQYSGAVYNKAQAVKLAVNKRLALNEFRKNNIPTLLQDINYILEGFDFEGQLVGRPDHHTKGKYFYICNNPDEVNYYRNLKNNPATHFMTLLKDFQEFRVHVVNNKSIKISEKIGNGKTKNHANGAIFEYPHNFNHKKTLRKLARKAVKCLGLDFGAVDIMYKDGNFALLEVNTAPCLTDETSDTLACYVKAFMDYEENTDSV
jgi:glutathione synthase/RimK-type ligase-like ATP-grasp enzyme